MPYFDKENNEYWNLNEILTAKGEYISIANIQNLGQKLSRMKLSYIKSNTGSRLYKKSDLFKHMKNLEAQIELKQNPLKELDELKQTEEDIYKPDGKINVLYSRVSGKTKEDSDELAKQNSLIMQYCISNGIKIDRQYRDMCSSFVFGKDKRPGLYELMKDMFAGNIKNIYVLSPDVISPFFYEFFMELCSMCGVYVEIISNVPTDEAKKSITYELLSMSDIIKKRFAL